MPSIPGRSQPGQQVRGDHADDPEIRVRFVREAEITGGLEHPVIVLVQGLGTARTAECDRFAEEAMTS